MIKNAVQGSNNFSFWPKPLAEDQEAILSLTHSVTESLSLLTEMLKFVLEHKICAGTCMQRSGQVRSGQVRSGQVRSSQVRSGQVRCETGLDRASALDLWSCS